MKRMTTKMSTVTPKSTMTKSQSVGQGVKNIGKAKKSSPRFSMQSEEKEMPRFGMTAKVERKNAGMPSFGMEYTSMPKPKKERMTTSKTTTNPKPKAKMLPEVKVTAPGKLKRFVSKLTSKRK